MSHSQPQPIPGKGGRSRDQEITDLMNELQDRFDIQVGSPESAEHDKEQARQVLNRLVKAASPHSDHTSSEVTSAIQAARNLLGK